MSKKENKYKIMTGCVIGLAGALCAPAAVMAGAADFLEGQGNGAFDALTNTAKATGASAFNLMTVIGIIAVVGAVICAGLGMAFNSSGQARNEHKSKIMWIVAAALFIFGAIPITNSLIKVGRNLDSTSDAPAEQPAVTPPAGVIFAGPDPWA